jgi:hypothetical protein
MNEHVEYGYCPTCGSKDFNDLDTWESCQKHLEPEDKWTWTFDGWKARILVYVLFACALIFGLVPWIWGWCSFFKRIF